MIRTEVEIEKSRTNEAVAVTGSVGARDRPSPRRPVLPSLVTFCHSLPNRSSQSARELWEEFGLLFSSRAGRRERQREERGRDEGVGDTDRERGRGNAGVGEFFRPCPPAPAPVPRPFVDRSATIA